MNICFTGFDSNISIDAGQPTVFEIHNCVLFTRTCKSLLSGAGDSADEPYSIWENDARVKPATCFLNVANLFELPWDDRSLNTALLAHMDGLFMENDASRNDVEGIFASLLNQLQTLALQLESDYKFEVDWEMKRFLKSFGFGIDVEPDSTLLDSLILFLKFVKDVNVHKVLLFINLKLFLSKSEYEQLVEQIFFENLSVLLLENIPDASYYPKERKYVIDQDFLEGFSSCQEEMSASLQ